MEQVTFKLEGQSAYSQSGFLVAKKLDRETADKYEARIWKTRMHATEPHVIASDGTVSVSGMIVIPAMALKQALDAAAKYRSMSIPGQGKKTYTKCFTSGVLCSDGIVTDVEAATVKGEWINANSDGIRGSGKRVRRCYPLIPSGWKAEATVMILDEIIVHDVFIEHLKLAGQLIGVGRFRPQNGGFNGRFKPSGFQWEEIKM